MVTLITWHPFIKQSSFNKGYIILVDLHTVVIGLINSIEVTAWAGFTVMGLLQSSRWAPVLWPRTSKTLFGPVNFLVFIENYLKLNQKFNSDQLITIFISRTVIVEIFTVVHSLWYRIDSVFVPLVYTIE